MKQFTEKMFGSKKQKTGSVPVYLNVYDLTSMNGYAYWLGLGVYHSGLQVHGVEYAFGAHELPTTGIFEGEPKQCPGFTFRKSILVGRTDLTSKEVRSFIEKLAEDYTGKSYNLITKNCNHFCNDACMRMTGKSIPRWVNRLARIGLLCTCIVPLELQEAKIRQRKRVEGSVTEGEKKKLRSRSSRFLSSSSINSTTSANSPSIFRNCCDKEKEKSKRVSRASSLALSTLSLSPSLPSCEKSRTSRSNLAPSPFPSPALSFLDASGSAKSVM